MIFKIGDKVTTTECFDYLYGHVGTIVDLVPANGHFPGGYDVEFKGLPPDAEGSGEDALMVLTADMLMLSRA